MPAVSNTPRVVHVTDVAEPRGQAVVTTEVTHTSLVGLDPAQAYVAEATSTVIVSPLGVPGPPGMGFRLLGRLPAGTQPSAFPTSPAPRPGDYWSVGGSVLFVWDGDSWERLLELGPTPTYTESFALSDAVPTISVPVTHGLNTRDVTVECQLRPSGRQVQAEVTSLSANTVAVTLTTGGTWSDTTLRVQVRP